MNIPSTCVIKFTAPWCGPCKRIQPLLHELSQQRGALGYFWKRTTNPGENVIRSADTPAAMPEGDSVITLATPWLPHGLESFSQTVCVNDEYFQPVGIPIFEINVDDEPNVCNDYEVTSIPHMVFRHDKSVVRVVTSANDTLVKQGFQELVGKLHQIVLPKSTKATLKNGCY